MALRTSGLGLRILELDVPTFDHISTYRRLDHILGFVTDLRTFLTS